MLFSVIIPAYNAEYTIVRCINSVLLQTIDNYEIIVVDDGSTDYTSNKVKEIADKCNKIKMRQQKNSGPGAARNTGISLSQGDYIAFLDADDYWETDYLETIVRCSNQGKSDVIFLDVIKERQDGSVISFSNNYRFRQCPKKELICNQMTGRLPWGMIKVIKRDLIIKNNISFANLKVGEEAIFSFELLNHSQTISFADKPIYHYVQSSMGQHKKGNLDPWGDVVSSMKKHLETIGLLEQYEANINSFALRALSLSVNRCTLLTSYTKYKKTARKKFEEYSTAYDFNNVNTRSVDKTSLIILLLLKHKMYLAINVAAKLRRKKLAY